MSKSNMFDLPGAGAMNDTLEFVKNMWGGMKVPGMAMPSLSVDDINKQIADLKAVESWLTLNMNMLRGTIQALEVQSATLATLQSMGETMSAAMSAPNPHAKPARTPNTAQEKPAADGSAAFDARFDFSPPVADKPPAPKAPSQSDAAVDENASSTFEPPEAIPPFADAAAWWNTLQSQFNQAVSSALVPEPKSISKPVAPPKSAAKGKPASKTAPKTASKDVPKSRAKSPAKKTATARKRAPATKK